MGLLGREGSMQIQVVTTLVLLPSQIQAAAADPGRARGGVEMGRLAMGTKVASGRSARDCRRCRTHVHREDLPRQSLEASLFSKVGKDVTAFPSPSSLSMIVSPPSSPPSSLALSAPRLMRCFGRTSHLSSVATSATSPPPRHSCHVEGRQGRLAAVGAVEMR